MKYFKTTVVLNILILVFSPILAFAQVSYEDAFPNISFNVPVEIQNAADGSNRMFVLEQSGTIKVFPNTQNVTNGQVSTFIDLSQKITYNAGQEIGLLGLAFHPQFSSNRYIYVYYIDRPSNYRINIVRYQVSSSNANMVDTATETIIAQYTKNQGESNHNGGKIAFGPDGYLYISIGDGGGGGDPQGNAQNLNTVFGSILRLDIDIDGNNPIEENPDLPNGNYEIPSNNPRRGQSGLDELYAWGIRNTWKFSFDETGRLWGADVGQSAFEEINIISNGANYGWNRFEGNSDYNTNSQLTTSPDTKPVFTYGHTNGDKSITGGYVYRGSLSSASLQGNYIYGDFLTGRVWALNYNASNGSASSELLFRASGQAISTFGEDEAGELYFASYGANGKIFKLSETVSGPVTTAVNGIGDWKSLNSGTNGSVNTIATSTTGTRHIGGNFTTAGGISVSNLALISIEEQWQAFGSGSNGAVHSIAIAPNGNVFAGGAFSQIGGVSANNIAFWNGSNWSPMGTGTNGEVLQLKFDQNGNLYIAGVFSTANGITVNNIARWQNNTWFALTDSATNSSGTNNEVRSIGIDPSNNVYVGGNFDTAGGVSASRIARWNGTNWTALGSGTSGFVQAITIAEDFLYAAGNFSLAGNSTVNRIARWNLSSATWEALGNGLSGSVNALEWDGNYVYAAGDFETASNVENINLIVNNIARWNEASGWQALGPNTQVGVNTSINTLSFSNTTNELYVGGNFSTSGAIQTNNIAVWSEAFCTEDSVIPEYQVNGVWDSGSNTLTLNLGDTLVLSILPNDTNFTVSLPNGESFPNDYNLGAVNLSMAGTYIFTTAQGCTENFELIINENQNEDADNDGVTNDADACPDTPSGETVDANGCSSSQLDDDVDGVTNNLDSCPDTPSGETADANGCSSSQLDDDGDGVTNNLDLCPNTPSGETVDANGCANSQLNTDSDTDGVTDDVDVCPNTPSGETVDANGCSSSQLNTDSDTDGVTDDLDVCPNTPSGETVDAKGCSSSQLNTDSDTDGVPDDVDVCPNTPSGETVDSDGCAASQLDDDLDGVNNAIDECPNTPEGTTVNNTGCEESNFPNEQFSIGTTANSCENGVDGQINVSTTITGNYTALLTDTAENTRTYEFTNTLDITQLDTGIYSLCMYETNFPNVENCYSLTIDASSVLEVESFLNETGKSVVLNLRGATKYFISFNEKRLETASNQITIDLDKEVNTLEVSSDNSCHELYEETILMKDAFIVYPNPIRDFVSIDVSKLSDEQIDVSLFSATGKLLLNQPYTTEEDVITIDTSGLTSGYYLIRISGKTIEKAFKIIK